MQLVYVAITLHRHVLNNRLKHSVQCTKNQSFNLWKPMESRLSLVLGDLMRIVGTRQKRSNRDPLGAFLEPLRTVSQVVGAQHLRTEPERIRLLSIVSGPVVCDIENQTTR